MAAFAFAGKEPIGEELEPTVNVAHVPILALITGNHPPLVGGISSRLNAAWFLTLEFDPADYLVLVTSLAALVTLAAARFGGLAAFAIFTAARRSGRGGLAGGEGHCGSEDASREQRLNHMNGVGLTDFS